MAFAQRFAFTLPFGSCVGVALPDVAPPESEWPAALHAHERAFAQRVGAGRRASWIGGRLALRAALQMAGLSSGEPILATERGAPLLPPGVTGSISHKPALAVAIAASAGTPRGTVGIDLERLRPLRADIADRVLTERERALLPAAGPARDAQVLRVFSAKEAIYKALDPWLRRFIGFHEAEVSVSGGALSARLALGGGEGEFVIDLHDLSARVGPGWVLTAARARR